MAFLFHIYLFLFLSCSPTDWTSRRCSKPSYDGKYSNWNSESWVGSSGVGSGWKSRQLYEVWYEIHCCEKKTSL